MNILKDVQLQSFKCFDETPKLEFGRITLLLGANSAGKSSLMYSILTILQSIPTLMQLSLNNVFVQLGNFDEAVYNHDKKRIMHINFTIKKGDVDYTFKTSWRRDNKTNQPVLKTLLCQSDYYMYRIHENPIGRKHYLLDLQYDYTLSKEATELHEKSLKGLQEFVNSDKFPYLNAADYGRRLIEWFSPIDEQNIPINLDVNIGAMIRNDSHASTIFNLVLLDSSSLIMQYASNINFISSYRTPAQRLYVERSLPQGKIMPSGNGFVQELLKWRDEDKERYEQLTQVLRELGMLYSVESSRREEGNFVVRVQVNENGPKANLSDVGFGISQLLPVIIADLELQDESTLFAAQPEIHLHPNVQANLGDYFVKQIKTSKKNYVIETHSECLMNRLRLLIVKGDLQPEDIRVYYISQGNEANAVIHHIQFTSDGRIIGAPTDFFETYMMDIMNIAMESAR